MTYWSNIRSIDTTQFSVRLDYTDEVDADLSWADAETMEKIESGEWGVYLFRVQVLFNGREVGSDYLGGSVYADPDDFAKEHLTGSAYFPDMVATAIAEARAELSKPLPYVRQVAA